MTEKPGPSPCNTESAIFSASTLDNTSSDWAFVNAVAEMEKVIPWYRHSNTEFSQSVSPVTQLCPTLCDPMNYSTPGLPVHHQLPEFTQTHVHRVGVTHWQMWSNLCPQI